MNKYLALDLGTKTGYAVFKINPLRIIKSGTQDFKPTRFETNANRFVKFKNFLKLVIKEHDIQAISYEIVTFGAKGFQAAQIWGGLVSLLLAEAEEQSIPVFCVNVKTLKKDFAGKGNASKEMMIATATGKFSDITVVDDNHADALALAYVFTENKDGVSGIQ